MLTQTAKKTPSIYSTPKPDLPERGIRTCGQLICFETKLKEIGFVPIIYLLFTVPPITLSLNSSVKD